LDDGPLGRGALEAISIVSGEKLVGLGFEDRRLSATLALPVSEADVASVFEGLFFGPDRGGPELRLDPARRLAFANGRQVLLTRTEFRLLQLLNDSRPADVPFADVLKSVWGYAEGEATTELVRSHLRNLRRKLRGIGLQDALHSRRGRGYVLEP
jgi:DNA-binding CsgD family transcriptional regulator